jgi:hypothetical protein
VQSSMQSRARTATSISYQSTIAAIMCEMELRFEPTHAKFAVPSDVTEVATLKAVIRSTKRSLFVFWSESLSHLAHTYAQQREASRGT